jgi:4-hydroxy-tetrahydrodipicolinate reductase
MKIALIGHGAMGKLVERLIENGERHEICAIIGGKADAHLSAFELSEKLRGRCAAAIDFSVAEAVKRNIEACVLADVPIVEGTTGWNAQFAEIQNFVNEKRGALVYGANFSVGVNLFYKIVDFAAELFAKFDDYEVFIEEQHHSRKRDAPSGTALKLKTIIEKRYDVQNFSVAATRAGNIPGTHRVGFDGTSDQILLTHTARSREGFAVGALIAAEWISGKKGVFEFSEIMQDILQS